MTGKNCIVPFFLVSMLAFLAQSTRSETPATKPQTLNQARAALTMEHLETDYQSSGELLPPDLKAYSLVKYPSAVGDLGAFLTCDPRDGKKHPVVVWAHGGFGSIDPEDLLHHAADNDQTPDTFREVGFVVMYPSWRGENNNPGKFELFMGEVDDLIAAVKYVKTLPYVDADRVYLMGHSSGGTLVLLAAELGVDVRQAVSFGGSPGVAEEIKGSSGNFYRYKKLPFDWKDDRQLDARSPALWVTDMKVQTTYIEGVATIGDMHRATVMTEMGERAKTAGVPFAVHNVSGASHFTVLRSAKRLIAQKLLLDTGPKPVLDVTDAELKKAFTDCRDAKPRLEEKPFATLTAPAATQIKSFIDKMNARQKDSAYFYRVLATPDDTFDWFIESAYDIDDIQCTVEGINVVMDKKSYDALAPILVQEEPHFYFQRHYAPKPPAP